MFSHGSSFNDKSLKLIQVEKDIDTLVLSIILALKMSSEYKKMNKVNKILVISPLGFASKKNKKIIPLMDKVIKDGSISIVDKYLTKADLFIEIVKGSSAMSPTPYWREVEKKMRQYNTVIFSNLYPFILSNKVKSNTFSYLAKGTKMILDKFTETSNVNLITIESNEQIIDDVFDNSKREHIYLLKREDSKISIVNNPVSEKKKQELFLTPNSPQIKESKEEENSLTKKRKLTLANITSSTLKTLPNCPTGNDSLDELLDGGIEMGQVVSVISDSESLGTNFMIHLSLQTPSYFSSLLINLSMSQRKLQELLRSNKYHSQREGAYSDHSSVHTATLSVLEEDGEIDEIIETIQYYYSEEDCRFVVIDNDMLLNNSKREFSDTRRELDSIYKKLKLLAAKLDIAIIVLSLSPEVNDTELCIIPIENSINAISYVSTQIVLSSSKNVYVSKKIGSLNKDESRLLTVGSANDIKPKKILKIENREDL